MPVMLGGDLIVGFDGHEITGTQDMSGKMNRHRGRHGDSDLLSRAQEDGSGDAG